MNIFWKLVLSSLIQYNLWYPFDKATTIDIMTNIVLVAGDFTEPKFGEETENEYV